MRTAGGASSSEGSGLERQRSRANGSFHVLGVLRSPPENYGDHEAEHPRRVTAIAAGVRTDFWNSRPSFRFT